MATLAQGLQKLKNNAGVKAAVGLAALGALTGCDYLGGKKGPSTEDRVTALEQKTDKTSADVQALTKSVGTLATNQMNLQGLVFAVGTNVTGMRAEMKTMQSDMGTVKQGLADLRTDLNAELVNIRNEIAASEARTLGAVTNYVGGGTAVVMNSAGQAIVTGQAMAPTHVMVPATGIVSTPGIQLLSPGHAIPGTTLVLGVGQYATPMPTGGHLVIDLRDPGVKGFVRSRQVFFVTSRGAVCDVDGYNSVGLPFVRLSEKTAYHRAHTRLAAYAQNRKVRAFCEAYERNGR